MDASASAQGAPLLYRACFLVGCGLLVASGVAGIVRAFSGRDPLPGAVRLDARAAAEAFEASGALGAAARELRMLTVLDPGDCPSFDALGEVLAREGDPEGSLRVHLRHVSIHPYSAAAHTSLGLAFLRLSRFDEALGSFSMAVRLNPGDAVALASMGDIARQNGRLDEAVSRYERALRFSGDSARLQNKLAIAHALAGRHELAERHFEEALRLDPSFTEARTNLGHLAGRGGPTPAQAR